MDVTTGLKLPENHPVMQIVNRVWNAASVEEHEAFHRVCCLNGRDENDMAMMKDLAGRIQKAILN